MIKPVLSPFPELRTNRLVLRELHAGDAEELLRLRRDERVLTYLPFGPMPSLEEAHAFIHRMDAARRAHQSVHWVLSQKGGTALMGTLVLWNFSMENHRAEIGYMLFPEFQGHGYAREAVAAVLDYGFKTLGLHAVQAVVDPRNQASAALLERLGFCREALFKSAVLRRGEWLDEAVYTLLEPGFRTS